MNLNKHQIIGRMTRDPEVKVTATGQSVANFSVATNSEWKNSAGEKQKDTQFHNVVVWGKLADICAQYLKKGQLVYISGRVQHREWETKEGTKRSTTEIVAEEMQMGPKSQGGTEGAPDAPREGTEAGESFQGRAERAVSKAVGKLPPQEPEIRVEDIPF